MKIKRDTTYNQNAKPFIRENMNSWIPPTFQAMTLWPVFAGDSRYTKGYWVSHNHFENLDIQIVQEGNLKIYYDGGISLLIVLAIENVSNFQMHNEPRLFQRIF